MGLRWLTRRSSGNFLGFPADATIVADAVAAALRNRRRPATNQASLVRHWACQTLGLSDIGLVRHWACQTLGLSDIGLVRHWV
jgi:hypothetical protein